MDELNHLGWVVYKTYEIGGYMFGIRTNSLECGEWLEATLAAYEVADEEAEPYFSLWVPEAAEGVGKQYYILYRESEDLLRTLEPARLAERLLGELVPFTLRKKDDAVYLDACVVERGGVHALIPSPVIPYMRLAGRRVERDLTLPVAPTVGVAPDGRLFAVADELEVPGDAGEDLAWRLGVHPTPNRVSADVPESADIVCAFHYDPAYDPILPLTRAATVHTLAQRAYNLPVMRGAALQALAELVDGARCYLLQEAQAKQALELLTAVLDDDDRVIPQPAA